eukprot:1793155-Amphidinium_carterae.1
MAFCLKQSWFYVMGLKSSVLKVDSLSELVSSMWEGGKGENNMGLLTVSICDAVVQSLEGWSLVTMNGGNFGADGQACT